MGKPELSYNCLAPDQTRVHSSGLSIFLEGNLALDVKHCGKVGGRNTEGSAQQDTKKRKASRAPDGSAIFLSVMKMDCRFSELADE